MMANYSYLNSWVSDTDGFVYNGEMLYRLGAMFPGYVFTSRLNMETRRYCVFVCKTVARGTNIPTGNPIAEIEVSGSSEEDYQILCTKLALICG